MEKRYGEPFIDRVDKNGTEHWVDHNCPRCGGTGYLPGYEFSDGARCWKCGATGQHTHTWIVMTPEYEEKLIAKRAAKARKKNLAERAEFLMREGFNSDGITFVVIGKTFEMKDELKTAGARFDSMLGWHFASMPECLITIEMTIADCFYENSIAALIWNDRHEIQDLIKARTPHEVSASEYLGEIGKRLTVTAVLKKSFSFQTNFSYYPTTSYIHNFEDASGNVLIWKTASPLDEGLSYTVTGTVKEHGEYRGVKQTVLTRCKV